MLDKVIFCIAVCVGSASLPGAEASKSPPATGSLRLTFTESSPLSSNPVLLQRLDLTNQPASMDLLGDYHLQSHPLEVVVPRTYRPTQAHGVFVWMGVSDFPPAWLESLARHRLILVCANIRQGHVAPYPAALDAVHNVKRLYRVDEQRVYASGFSAGGQLAAIMVRAFPDVFHGGLFLMGGYFYHCHRPFKGQGEPTVESPSPAWKGPMDEIKQNMRLVIMKGGSDPEWTPEEGRSDYQGLWLDGFRRVTYLEVRGLGHTHPDTLWFERGLAALEESKPLTSPIVTPTKEPRPLPGQIAQAQRILATAQFYLEAPATYYEKQPTRKGKEVTERMRKSNQERARTYLQRVLDEYPTAPAAVQARALLSGMDRALTKPAQ
jgi:hypothetical protein